MLAHVKRSRMINCSSGFPQGLSSSTQGFSLAMLCLLIKLEYSDILGYKIKLYTYDEKEKRESFIELETQKIRERDENISEQDQTRLDRSASRYSKSERYSMRPSRT